MKKTLNVIKNVFVWLVVLLAVSMMIFTIISVTTFNRNDRSLFGYKMYIVNTDSMAATDFKAGALIIVKEVDPSTLKEGDIISFISQNAASFGEVLTHKIRKITTNENGEIGFVTYGTTTGVDDGVIVTYPYVMGKYERQYPSLGRFFGFLKTTTGYVVCILVPFLPIIIYEAIRFFGLFRRFRKEQLSEMQMEKEKLEAERAENAKMLEELRTLKAELEGMTATVEERSGEDNAANE